jgi:DNA-binding response OmpR family regulator
MRILQVEDDGSAAQSIEKMLASKGHKCETTAYGEDAVKRAMSGAYDLILLDIILPDIDGYEVLRRLGQAGINTPVVIQTGIVSRKDVDKAASLGTKYYLLKPFSRDELSTCIDAAIADDMAAAKSIAQSAATSDRRDDFRDTGASRRSKPRMRTLKSAQIVYNNHTCVADCSVINTSEGGAALQLRDFVEYPPNFQLKVHRGATYNCEVCWQSGNKIGVRFLQE